MKWVRAPSARLTMRLARPHASAPAAPPREPALSAAAVGTEMAGSLQQSMEMKGHLGSIKICPLVAMRRLPPITGHVHTLGGAL